MLVEGDVPGHPGKPEVVAMTSRSFWVATLRSSAVPAVAEPNPLTAAGSCSASVSHRAEQHRGGVVRPARRSRRDRVEGVA